MDVKEAVRAIRKHWISVVILVLIGIAGAAVLVIRATPEYQSSVTFFVSTPASDDAAALASDQFANKRVNTYIRLASSERLANLVLADTTLDLGTVPLSREISASSDLNTVLITVRVVDPNRPRSLQIARAIGRQFPTLISAIEPASNQVRLTVVSGPRLSPDPIRPSRILTLGLGLIAGLLLGVGLALLRELLDNTVHSQDLLRELSGQAVLGSVGFDGAADAEPLLVGRQVRSIRAEAFRQVRTNLQFMNVDNPARVIVVTSSVAGEGKSTTSANLAMVFAEAGKTTLLIEADMRRPRVTEYLGLERSVGLSNVLAGQVEVDEVLQRWGDVGLTVLSGGTVPPNPSEMLGSRGMVDLLAAMRERFDAIIIDTPPLLPVTDAAVTAVHADGVVVVVRYGSTTRTQLTTALQSLRAVDARVYGTIFNMTKIRGSVRKGYDGYGYYEDRPDIAPALGDLVRVAAHSGSSDAARDDADLVASAVSAGQSADQRLSRALSVSRRARRSSPVAGPRRQVNPAGDRPADRR